MKKKANRLDAIKMCKEHEEGIVYLCHVGKWIL